MSFRLVNKEILTLKSREEVIALATKLQAMGGTESEREIRNHRKARIKEKILSGEMMPFKWVVAHVPSLGLTERENGHHSSEVFLELTAEEWTQVRFPVLIDWEEYECDTRKDCAILFEQFDPSWSSRSKDDLVGAHMGIHTHLKGIPRHVGNHVTAGLLWYAFHVEGKPKESRMQFEFFHSNHDIQPFLLWSATVLQPKRTPELFNTPVIAAMYHTTRGEQEAAKLVWKDVAKGYAALEEDSIAFKLDKFLEMVKDEHCEWPAAIRRQFRPRQYKPSDKDVFGTCLRAVARAVKGQQLTEVFMSAKDRRPAQLVEALYPLPDPTPTADGLPD